MITGWLHTLFSFSFAQSILPSVWQKAFITPIPKSADKDPFVPLNYGGIRLLSCVFKIYTGILNCRISQYYENNGLINEEQNGFRKGRACIEHSYVLASLIRNTKNCVLSTYVAFVDFQKAFDWVNREQYRFAGHLYNAIKCIYSKTLSCIKLNSILAEWFDVTSGVRQGDTLSPTLFNLYINDLATGIKDLHKGVDFINTQVSLLLYADDIVLIADDEQSLRDQLNYLYEWCNKWRLSINNSKIDVHFRPNCVNRTPFEFQSGKVIIETTDHYKHLGLMDEFVTFESCATVLSQPGNRALGALRNKIRNFKDCRYQTFTKLYQTCVAPILDYGSGVWGYDRFSKTRSIMSQICVMETGCLKCITYFLKPNLSMFSKVKRSAIYGKYLMN